jgi:hypothetical protein
VNLFNKNLYNPFPVAIRDYRELLFSHIITGNLTAALWAGKAPVEREFVARGKS